MGIRGRQSAAELFVVAIGVRGRKPAPPAGLTDAQAAVWRDCIGSLQLARGCYPLLIEYCRRVCRSRLLESQIAAFQLEWAKGSRRPRALRSPNRDAAVRDVKAGEIPGRSDAWQLAAKAGQMGAGRVFAVLITPNTPNAEISTRDAAKAASRTLGERIQVLRAGTPVEFEAAFLALGPMQAPRPADRSGWVIQ